jgi:uncharacterized protein YecE (DUF72 family)
MAICIGTAGWSIPREAQAGFPGGGSHLERYAAVLPAVEINSTFHRPHRASTFERWAASVPRGFRFSVKIPRTVTHDQKLAGSAALLEAFLADLAPLGVRLGCLLVQLPPSLAFDARVARRFFTALRKHFSRGVALEPRHSSWFDARADRLLDDYQIARVAADPPRVAGGNQPGGWRGLAYFRLHGSPRMYYSSYEDAYLAALADPLRALQARRIPTWCIFDNTTLGAATGNALSLLARLTAAPVAPDAPIAPRGARRRAAPRLRPGSPRAKRAPARRK